MKKAVGLRNFFKMYYDGFRNLSKTSKTLWIIILIKLFIMFAVMRALTGLSTTLSNKLLRTCPIPSGGVILVFDAVSVMCKGKR